MDFGLRPKASEICLPAPENFPFGDVQTSSSTSFVLTLSITVPIWFGALEIACFEAFGNSWEDLALDLPELRYHKVRERGDQ